MTLVCQVEPVESLATASMMEALDERRYETTGVEEATDKNGRWPTGGLVESSTIGVFHALP